MRDLASCGDLVEAFQMHHDRPLGRGRARLLGARSRRGWLLPWVTITVLEAALLFLLTRLGHLAEEVRACVCVRVRACT
jgi:hypothetical protein